MTDMCSVNGCGGIVRTRGMCGTCYVRAWRRGEHTDLPARRLPPLCCICLPPAPEPVYGGVQCSGCGRPCGENYTAMRASYLSR